MSARPKAILMGLMFKVGGYQYGKKQELDFEDKWTYVKNRSVMSTKNRKIGHMQNN